MKESAKIYQFPERRRPTYQGDQLFESLMFINDSNVVPPGDSEYIAYTNFEACHTDVVPALRKIIENAYDVVYKNGTLNGQFLKFLKLQGIDVSLKRASVKDDNKPYIPFSLVKIIEFTLPKNKTMIKIIKRIQ